MSVHLKIRTEYSFGRTFAPIDRIVQRLKEVGTVAAGIVDPGTWGHVRWAKACKEAGIKPLFGVEIAILTEDEDLHPRMWFLAANQEGLRELYKWSSRSHVTAIGKTPCLSRSNVLDMSDNIYKFAGEVVDGEFLHEARAILDLSPASQVLNMRKRAISKEFGLHLVNTCDNAYAYPEDRESLELIADRAMKPTEQHIPELLPQEDIPVSVLESMFDDVELPVADMLRTPGDLGALCVAGIEYRKKHNGLQWTTEYAARLKRELDLIRSKDFESYFLIVADMVNYAKQHMLVGPSRGSSAGSLVCYLTRITEIDPIPPGLYFERFIDESRTDLPDIDLDFPGKKRHLVFEYMERKYGAANVAHIGTVSTYRPKSALIKVCKRLGIPPVATYAIKVAMITRSSGDARASDCLRDTIETTKPGQQLAKMYPDVIRACEFEGHASHTGVHAAGLLVCNVPIMEYCTVMTDGTAQIDKKDAEALGLLKIDVLGLRTLDVLEDSGVPVQWYELLFNDERTFNEVFNRQSMSGIFQFEGQSMRNLSRQINFESIDDVDVVTALARPGPFGGGVTAEWMERKNGKAYKALHPKVARYMEKTFGLPVYQEQTLAIVREIGKFDWGRVTDIRKAMSKRKGKEFFNRYWEEFKVGAAEQGIPEREAKETWELINAMGAWQMNKAHTYSYAVISYWTAWLKAHFPLEFAAANMRNAKDSESAIALLQEMVREGLKYEPFHPLKSKETWAVIGDKLVAGFDSLRGFGRVKAKKFMEARDKGDLTDSQKMQLGKATSPFDDIFPMETKFASYYNDPRSHGILQDVYKLGELDGTQAGSFVFIGRIIQKNLRDANEEVNVKKRGGKRVTGPVWFLDFRVQDDTGQLQVRIDRFKYQAIGKTIFEDVPNGTAVLLRCRFVKDIRFGFVQKVKVLE